jgi:hypothetical protein
MSRVPLGTSDYSRSVAQIPGITLFNRYFEMDPTNQEDQVALLCRPAIRKWLEIGSGPIRNIYSQPGTFGEALFVVSGDTVYKVKQDETVTIIGTLGTSTGSVSMSATDWTLFIADGAALYYYTENSYARATLTLTGAISDTETVTIGSMVYQFTAGDVDTGTPAGTSGAPWLVALGGSTEISLENLAKAIGNTGELGTDYSSLTISNPDVAVTSSDATTLVIRSAYPGADGNSIVTTETLANGSWDAATLSGGGDVTFAQIEVPDDDGIISVGVIISFCICVVTQGQGKNGRFYWIRPGEITIDALDFATAEKAPDPVWQGVGAHGRR